MTQEIQGIDLTLFDDNNVEINRAALTKLIVDWKKSERELVINHSVHKTLGNTEMTKLLEEQLVATKKALVELRDKAESFNKSLNGSDKK